MRSLYKRYNYNADAAKNASAFGFLNGLLNRKEENYGKSIIKTKKNAEFCFNTFS